jgi:hypothetical protein
MKNQTGVNFSIQPYCWRWVQCWTQSARGYTYAEFPPCTPSKTCQIWPGLAPPHPPSSTCKWDRSPVDGSALASILPSVGNHTEPILSFLVQIFPINPLWSSLQETPVLTSATFKQKACQHFLTKPIHNAWCTSTCFHLH